MEASNKKYMTPPEYGALFEVDGRTVRRWCEAGRIPGVIRTPGGHWRIPTSAVDLLAHSGQDPSPKEVA